MLATVRELPRTVAWTVIDHSYAIGTGDMKMLRLSKALEFMGFVQ
jgi:hypothetical protein